MKTEFKNILPFILKKIKKGAAGVKIKKIILTGSF
jgi:hypothetical protein